MTTQHAPGPWYIDCQNESAAIGYRAIVDKDGYTVCNPSPMGQANACLIAAAPDLKDIVEALVGLACDRELRFKEFDPVLLALADRARAAIAKATGAA